MSSTRDNPKKLTVLDCVSSKVSICNPHLPGNPIYVVHQGSILTGYIGERLGAKGSNFFGGNWSPSRYADQKLGGSQG